ncbi:hypothetical protein [Sporisorium scitamineum]|uniref:SUZ domain-containing protein n=1 Tax=Sporisorium scitamineum TaxID=49012 RepID=A0A0F7RWM2_9BASI|nr:hypothetical protein [Sporisorium scitamineum]
MTQVDALATALAATSVHTASGASEASTSNVSNLKTSKPSFASVFRSGQTAHSSILTKDTAASSAASSSTTIPPASVDTSPHAVPAAAEPSSSSLLCEPAPVGDTILQAIRKRDDRIFFSQYENQMAALVRDPTRTSIELGAMNAYQRLLVYRCADQFQLEHRLDRATNCITLSKTASTSHPSALLSIRAREFLVQRDGIDPVSVHPAIANLAASSTPETTNTSSPSSSASTSSPASPAPAPAAILSSSSNAPKPGFQIMRRDPSKNRQSPLCSADNDSNDPDKAAAKARKDMTLEERLASYRAARARIFGGAATNTSSGSASPTSSTPPPESSEVNDQAGDAASISRDHKASPSSSAASSLVASPVAARPVSRSKKPSSSATQDGPAQKGRGKTKGKGAAAQSTSDSTHDDPEFSRALPMSSHPASPPAFGALQQSSPLSLPGHVAHGYFPPMQHPALLQQSQSNPNLRSRAPAFHPQGSSTPAYSTGGGLRHPADVAAQTQRLWSQPGEAIQADAFPAPRAAAHGIDRKSMHRWQDLQLDRNIT